MYTHVRKGMTQARFNEENAKVLYAEIWITSVMFGILFRSWWVFGVILFGFIALINTPRTAGFITFVFSVIWGLVAFSVGFCLGGWGGGIVCGVIGFLIGYRIHISAIEWSRDINY